MILKCCYCGKDFEAKRRDTKYCSSYCSRKASRERLAKGIDSKNKICAKCGKEFTVKNNAYNRRYCYECIPIIGESGAANRKIIKNWSIEYLGGKCSKCGYNKCILVCANCHREIHTMEE